MNALRRALTYMMSLHHFCNYNEKRWKSISTVPVKSKINILL